MFEYVFNTVCIPVVPHEAVPEVSKGNLYIYKTEEHLIEPFSDDSTRTKLASVCFVAARNWMRQQVLDHADAGSPPGCGRSQSTTICESSYVLQSTTPVLLCSTKYYSSTTLYNKVLPPVLLCTTQSTTPVLLATPVPLCTTKCYSSTTLYNKVLLQYHSEEQSSTPVLLQSTTPVLLCTTKYYSRTTLYYKVLLQYYSVLQSTTPVRLCTTKYCSSIQSTTPVLLCTTKYYSSTTLYYKVLLQYYSVLQSTTLYYKVLLCTTKYYSSTTLYYKVLLQYYSVLLQ